MKHLLLLIFLVPFLSISQTQIGEDIDGEAQYDKSGTSICLASNGNTIAIGSKLNDGNGNNRGHIRIYTKENDAWAQIGEDIYGAYLYTGESVSLSADGSILAAGDSRSGIGGNVLVYENINNSWTFSSKISATQGNDLGKVVSLSSDGSIVAASGDGFVRVYKNINNTWNQIGGDIIGQHIQGDFGSSVSLSSDGSIVAVSTSFSLNTTYSSEYYTEVFKIDGNTWKRMGLFGFSAGAVGHSQETKVSLSENGNIIAIGCPLSDTNGDDSGQVVIFKYNIDTNIWNRIGQPISDTESLGDKFGTSVSLSSDGNIVAIGGPSNGGNGIKAGYVRIYKNTNDTWGQIGNDIDGEMSNDNSGTVVSLSGDGNSVAISAPENDGNGTDSGHVRIYDLSQVTLSTESFNQDYFSYYPNPVKNILNINLNSGQTLKQVNVYNMQSQYLYSVKNSKIDISNLSSGMYFIEVETNKGKSAKKIIVE